MSDIEDWDDVADGNSAVAPDGFPELMARSGVNNSAREVMAATKRVYDDPAWTNPYVGFTLTRQGSGTSWRITDAAKGDAARFMQQFQMVRMIQGGFTWIGYISNVPSYSGSFVDFTMTWQADISEDELGPTAVGTIDMWQRSGNVVYRNTGTDPENVPTMDDLEPYVTKPEDELDVGFIEGMTRSEVVAQSEGNILSNGDMSVWQRQTSFATANDDITADGWLAMSDDSGGPTSYCKIDRETDVPSGTGDEKFNYAMKIEATNITVAEEQIGVMTLVEAANGTHVSKGEVPESVSLSFWAKKTGAMDFIRAYFVKVIAGNPSVTPIQGWTSGSADLDVTWNPAGWEQVRSQRYTLSTVWTKFVMEDVPMDDLSTNGIGTFGVAFLSDDDSFASANALHITGVQVVRGAKAAPFLHRTIQEELSLAYRYYENSFDWQEGVFPGDNLGNQYAITGNAPSAGAGWLTVPVQFRQPKFKIPKITNYNPRAGTAGEWESADNVSLAPGVHFVSREMVNLEGPLSVAGEQYRIGWEAEANIWGNG